MVTCVWSTKGGAGVSVVVASLLARAERDGTPLLCVDASGDLPFILDLPEATAGLNDWWGLADAGPVVLSRAEVELGGGVSLLPAGRRRFAPTRDKVDALLAWLRGQDRDVLVDLGCLPPCAEGDDLPAISRWAAGADRSWMVTRACSLALHRSLRTGVSPDGVIMVREPARAIQRRQIADLIGRPVVAVIELDPAVARAVDAGRLRHRRPGGLDRAIRRLDAGGDR